VKPRRRSWSEEDDHRLEVLWGGEQLEVIAERLARTVDAVRVRAGQLKLGSPRRGTTTIRTLCRESGYSPSRVAFAVKALGLKQQAPLRTVAEKPGQRHRSCLTEEQAEQVLEFLRGKPDGQRLYAVPGVSTRNSRGLRSAHGVWGVATKPKACVGSEDRPCEDATRPHYAKGQCRVCWERQRRADRRVA
jgi:hypothetical protein